MLALLRRIKDTWSWVRFAYQLAVFLGITGVLGSVAASVWAVIVGVPMPIALMAGYCTLVGAVYLAMAPLAYRALSHTPANAAPKKKVVIPNYAAWRHLDAYEMQDAAKLWSNVDPNSPSTNESVAWFEVFKAKVIKKEFEIVCKNASTKDYEYSEPHEFTKIKKTSLKKFAADHGYDPIFLRDS